MSRTCKSCLVEKPVEEFHFYSLASPSYRCKPCHVDSERKRQKAIWKNNPEYRERHNNYGKAVRRGLEPPKVLNKSRGLTTICKICKEEKNTETEFPLRNTYRLKTCSVCYNKEQSFKYKNKCIEDTVYKDIKTYNANKSRYEHVYGVTVDHVVQTLESQNSKCANHACGTEISLTAPKELVKPAMVDHNHKTGKFRALLCNRCNTVLGHLEKNPHVIEGLKEYLIQFNN